MLPCHLPDGKALPGPSRFKSTVEFALYFCCCWCQPKVLFSGHDYRLHRYHGLRMYPMLIVALSTRMIPLLSTTPLRIRGLRKTLASKSPGQVSRGMTA